MIHPHHVGPLELTQWTGTQPLYPMTASLHKKTLAKIMDTALTSFPICRVATAKTHATSTSGPTGGCVGAPSSEKPEDLSPQPQLMNAAFDELLAHQLL